MDFFSNVSKLFRKANPAPPWFKLEPYADSTSFDTCDWLEQLFIRYLVKNRIEGSICLLCTDPTYDYVHKIGHGIIEINPIHSCESGQAPAKPAQFVSVSAMQGVTSLIELPDDMVTVMQEWNEKKLLPYMDIMLWQHIKGYDISRDALMRVLEMNEEMLTDTMPEMMEKVLSKEYLRALSHYAINQGGHGLPQGYLDA